MGEQVQYNEIMMQTPHYSRDLISNYNGTVTPAIYETSISWVTIPQGLIAVVQSGHSPDMMQ